MKRILMIVLVAIMVFGCTPCRKITAESAYMVWVQQGVKKNYSCVESLAEADAYIFKVAGLPLETDSLIGKRKPMLLIDNGDYMIYVEQESTWKKKRR